MVLSSQHCVAKALQSVVCDRSVSLGTQDETNRRVLIRQAPMLARIVQVKIHLSSIGVGKLADFQIDNDEATQSAMKE